MTKMPHALALAALMLTSAAQARDKDKPADPNRKICRREVPTGSLMPKSTCRTAAEWAAFDASEASAAHTTLDRAARNGIGATQ